MNKFELGDCVKALSTNKWSDPDVTTQILVLEDEPVLVYKKTSCGCLEEHSKIYIMLKIDGQMFIANDIALSENFILYND